jgi:pyrroline-5-carboxylate reductase
VSREFGRVKPDRVSRSGRRSVMSRPRKLGIIGSGAMAEALLRGWLGAGKFRRRDVLASDVAKARRDLFATDLRVSVTGDNREVARHADLLLLAVKPQVLESACRSIAAEIGSETLVVCIAAGVTLSTLESIFGADKAIVRVMPSILHTVQAGVAALCGNRAATRAEIRFVVGLFRSIGIAEEVEERLMDAVTGLSGSGPAFVFVFLEAMSDGGVAAGLPRALATAFAAQTALGAAKWVLEGRRPGELKELVTSPGGTTIAGLRAAEEMGLRSATIEAVVAAARRSQELGRASGEGDD